MTLLSNANLAQHMWWRMVNTGTDAWQLNSVANPTNSLEGTYAYTFGRPCHLHFILQRSQLQLVW